MNNPAPRARDRISTKPLSGMRDFLPVDVARRAHVIDVIRSVYRAYGFAEIETPTLESLDTLLGKYGDEGDQLLYRVLRRRDALRRVLDQAHAEDRPPTEAELAGEGLRYDLTVPLARVVAQYGDLPRFWKRMQFQPVWRADRPGRGRFREFWQCDADVTGTTSLVAEAEVLGAVSTVLTRLGFTAFELLVNHRELLRASIRSAEIPDELESTALIAVDKFDKIGADGVADELTSRGITAGSAEQLLTLIRDQPETSNAARLDYLDERIKDEAGRRAIADLRQLCAACRHNAANAALRVELRLARGLSYYTGPIFEIAVPDLAGSLGGGGRYDGLVGMFGKREVPAVGFSLGLERILVVMAERDMFPALSVSPDVMLCSMDVDMADVVQVAEALRRGGVRVETYPEPAKLKKQLQYAASPQVGVRFAAILGQDELDAGEVSLKHLGSGEQSRVSIADATQRILAEVGRPL
ncbi:MAG: histidine--tRNA ligase [Myxococcales bacterium FL481]|nr:MAG: histidine--tRNA ligase [Myxococcales bacterium FL481]